MNSVYINEVSKIMKMLIKDNQIYMLTLAKAAETVQEATKNKPIIIFYNL